MTLSRTWYTRAEVEFPDYSSGILQCKSGLWAIKALLMQQIAGGTVGASGAPPAGAAWTCYYSCDGTTAGTANDGVDRWGSPFDGSKLVYNTPGSAHSW